MNDLWRDVRYAVRQWRLRPGFAVVVLLTLGLGIGANVAIFSVVDGVLLSPLPYDEPDRLMLIHSQFDSLGFDKFWVSAPEFLEFREWNTSFEEVGAYAVRSANVRGADRPERVTVGYVTAGMFPVLGVEPERGRFFTEAEDAPNTEPVLVLSHELWMRSFNGDPALVGRTVEVDGDEHTVVGVMKPGFDVEDSGVEVWLPMAIDPADPGGRGSHFLYLIGRLADGVSPEAASQEMNALLHRWEEEFPNNHAPNTEGHGMSMRPLQEDLVGETRPAMLLLAGVVALVLLIACANVANLLLARAEARQREIAIRTALGAGGGRLMRQFLTESVLLSLLGGLVGTLLALGGLRWLLAADPEAVPRLGEVGIDGRVLLFALGVSIVTGLVFGFAPALHARARTFFTALKDGGRSSAGRGRQTFRRVLVVAEVALAVVLVVGAGLLLKSFWTLSQVDPGFEPEGVLSFQVSLPSTTYPDEVQVASFYERLTERLESLPGVQSVGAMTGLPPSRSINANTTQLEDVPQGPDDPIHNIDYYQFVTPGYFETLGVRAVDGRLFEAVDGADSLPVVIINERLAERFYPDRNPLGQRIRRGWFGDDEPWFTVVGVVEDVKQGGMDQEAGTELYFLHRQVPSTTPSGVPRTLYGVVRIDEERDPMSLAQAVRAEVARLDPALPVARMMPLTEVVGDALSRSRFLTLLVGAFGVLALLLAAVGTYGVLSYAVEQRRHEMGVRMALGADASRVLRLVLSHGMGLVAAGLVIGLGLAVLLRQAVASVLYGVTPGDPATFLVVTAVLLLTGLTACLVPAGRATRVDPMVALRTD